MVASVRVFTFGAQSAHDYSNYRNSYVVNFDDSVDYGIYKCACHQCAAVECFTAASSNAS